MILPTVSTSIWTWVWDKILGRNVSSFEDFQNCKAYSKKENFRLVSTECTTAMVICTRLAHHLCRHGCVCALFLDLVVNYCEYYYIEVFLWQNIRAESFVSDSLPYGTAQCSSFLFRSHYKHGKLQCFFNVLSHSNCISVTSNCMRPLLLRSFTKLHDVYF